MEWIAFGVILGVALVVGLVVRRRWSRWSPTPSRSIEAKAAEFRASTYRDTGGV
jgi:hypothetical protein